MPWRIVPPGYTIEWSGNVELWYMTLKRYYNEDQSALPPNITLDRYFSSAVFHLYPLAEQALFSDKHRLARLHNIVVRANSAANQNEVNAVLADLLDYMAENLSISLVEDMTRKKWRSNAIAYLRPAPAKVMQAIDGAFEEAAGRIASSLISSGRVKANQRDDVVSELTNELGGEFSGTILERLSASDGEAFKRFLKTRGQEGHDFVAKYEDLLVKERDSAVRQSYQKYGISP
jgi:hypothetical protein